MMRAYSIEKGHLVESDLEPQTAASTLREVAWIDLQEPNDEERWLVESMYPESLPHAHEVEEIESSARYFIEGSDIHVHSLFLYQSEGRHHTATVAFTLKPDRLLSIRDVELADFRLMRLRARRGRIEAENNNTLYESYTFL